MSEPDNPTAVCGWMKMYHPSGALVTLPVFGQWKEKAKGWDYAAAFSAVSDAIGCGFTVNAPGLEEGTQQEQVGYVLRMEKTNQDRTDTAVIHLYSANPAESYKFLTKYLNTDQDIEDFERAAGIGLAKLPIFPGTAAPQRGKDKQADKMITKVNPFPVIYEANPAYDPKAAEAATQANPYKVPKRSFVRWGNLPVGEPAKVNTEPADVVDQYELKHWIEFLNASPTGKQLTAECHDRLPKINDKYTKRAAWSEVTKYIEYAGIEYDANKKTFHDPVDTAQEDVGTAAAIPF